jgi:hypothetical protein
MTNNRKSFLKNIFGLGVGGVILTNTSFPKEENKLEKDKIIDLINKKFDQLNLINSTPTLNNINRDKYEYKEMIKRLDHFKLNKKYTSTYKELKNFVTNIRWHINRLEEDTETFYKDDFNSLKSLNYIREVGELVFKNYTLNTDRFLEIKYSILRNIGESYLMTNNKETCMLYFYKIKTSFKTYELVDKEYYNNPFGWCASILNKYEHYNEALEFSYLDQQERNVSCKTNSKLYKQLNKK